MPKNTTKKANLGRLFFHRKRGGKCLVQGATRRCAEAHTKEKLVAVWTELDLLGDIVDKIIYIIALV